MSEDTHTPVKTMPEPLATKAALFLASIVKPDLATELVHPGGLPEVGMHLQGRGVDVVATYTPPRMGQAGLVQWARARDLHLLVARMRPMVAEDAVFELVYSQQGITTMINDLVLYTNGRGAWHLCPTRGDVLYFEVGPVGIEPRVSTPWTTRHERLIGFRDAATLLSSALGE